MITLMIVNRLGTVHADRHGHTCNVAEYAPKRKAISPLQALVFKLPPCGVCWANATDEYRRIVAGGAS